MSGIPWQRGRSGLCVRASDFSVAPKPSPTAEGQRGGIKGEVRECSQAVFRRVRAGDEGHSGSLQHPAEILWSYHPRHDSEKWEGLGILDPSSVGTGCH